MDFRANPYIKTPLVGFFRTHSFLLAIRKIIINNAFKSKKRRPAPSPKSEDTGQLTMIRAGPKSKFAKFGQRFCLSSLSKFA